MITLAQLVVEKRAAVSERWLDAVLAEYGAETAARWRRQRDRFANPVGHALATGLPALVDAIASDEAPGPVALAALEGLVRIRSVQDLAPSRAIGFLHAARDAVRAELAAELAAGAHAAELAALDRRVERLVLRAFDLYVAMRDQMAHLRQQELRRSVSSLLRRWHGGALPEPPADDVVQLTRPAAAGARR